MAIEKTILETADRNYELIMRFRDGVAYEKEQGVSILEKIQSLEDSVGNISLSFIVDLLKFELRNELGDGVSEEQVLDIIDSFYEKDDNDFGKLAEIVFAGLTNSGFMKTSQIVTDHKKSTKKK